MSLAMLKLIWTFIRNNRQIDKLWNGYGIFHQVGGQFSESNSLLHRNALRNLVPFVQFEKREKHLWRRLLLVTLQA